MEFPLDGYEAERKPPPEGVVIGTYLDGDEALDVVGQDAIVTDAMFEKHFALVGATGGGKSSTVRTIIHGLTQRELQKKKEKEEEEEEGKEPEFEENQVIVFDANADKGMALLLGGCRAALGHTTFCFPRQRVNAWPGDWEAVFNRLLEIIPFAERGPAAFYTDAETVILQRACRLGAEPPRSSEDLLERIDYHRITRAFGVDTLPGVTEELVEALHMRVQAVFAHCGLALDGETSFADMRSAYFGIDTLTFGPSSAIIMRMLLSQLSYYIEHEKPSNRRLIVVIDEFAAFAGQVEIGKFIEHARKLGVCVIIISQTVAGLGDAVQILRILENSGVLMVHSTAAWEELARYIGAEEFPEVTWRFDAGGDLESEMARMVERHKVGRGELLSLPVGHIWVFRNNNAMMVKVKLPDTSSYGSFELPEQEQLFEAPEQVDESAVSVIKNDSDQPLEHGEAEEKPAKGEPEPQAVEQADSPQPDDGEQGGAGSDAGSKVATDDEPPPWDEVELPDGPDVGDIPPDQE